MENVDEGRKGEMIDKGPEFTEFFRVITGGSRPYPYQTRLALDHRAGPHLLDIPTGLGKTEAVLAAWLWNRIIRRDSTWPRRLVLCLPMRVLVEQTRDRVVLGLRRLGLLAGEAVIRGEGGKEGVESYVTNLRDNRPIESQFHALSSGERRVPVVTLMGGEDEPDWDAYPEREIVIIGTQDLLLSKALNRGYAISRTRWPMQFGLLNNDCLWVFDEIQLMGPGLATTSQLEAFRSKLGRGGNHGCQSFWMSATLQPDWLKTADFEERVDGLPVVKLDEDDRRAAGAILRAVKPLAIARSKMGESPELAEEVVAEHHRARGLTLVIVNTIARASELYRAIMRLQTGPNRKGSPLRRSAPASTPTFTGRLVLLHSRFRPYDRSTRIQELLSAPPSEGTICVTTQVVEAGVDISAITLFTELAPWASLVQRFGRCNRKGLDDERARVFLVDLPAERLADLAAPYEPEQLTDAREVLRRCQGGVGPSDLPVGVKLPYRHSHVVRRKDLIDLFDTTPDLAGNDIDIDRFVRDADSSDVRVLWRSWPQGTGHVAPPEDEQSPRHEELCPAPLGPFREFVKEHRGRVWRWNFMDGHWEVVHGPEVTPGHVFLVHSAAGGYTTDGGWDSAATVQVEPVDPARLPQVGRPDAYDDDATSHRGVWQTIAEHSEEVRREVAVMVRDLGCSMEEAEPLLAAASWHDRGKAHAVFQRALPDGAPSGVGLWAKAAGRWKHYDRRHFRHELASALAVLDPRNRTIDDGARDLIAYLVAAHHGRVRLSIRSLPGEPRPSPPYGAGRAVRRFARGIWDGDVLPLTDLGGGIEAPQVELSLEPMELGLGERPPFKDQPSWVERMAGLRDSRGPFHLAYLEALLRASDWRASGAALSPGRVSESSTEALHA